MRTTTEGVQLDEEGKIQIPLPLKEGTSPPQNKNMIYRRSNNTLQRLKRDEGKMQKCLDIMQDYLRQGHVRQLSKAEAEHAVTFIPVFPVHQEKKNKVRLVFDSSARSNDISLNDCLNSGPDETNRLIGVLIRFTHGPIAFSADVQQMFHCFTVPRKHQLLQYFFWFSENDPSKPIVPYAATVHVFGHTSSPSIATFGLRHTTNLADLPTDSVARRLIHRSFYVDDALFSDSSTEAVVAPGT